MKRYRVRLGYPRQVGSRVLTTELISAANAVVVDGVLKLKDDQDKTVALYKPGYWTTCRVVGS